MIRGTTAQFTFNMPYEFDKLCIIEATFWQPGNSGTVEAPLPITRIYSRNFTTIDVSALPDIEEADSKIIYKVGEEYCRADGPDWIKSTNLNEVYINNGIRPDENNAKKLFATLTVEETLRFVDTRKGYVQIKAYCDQDNVTFGSKPELFTVYPAKSTSLFGDLGPGSIDYDGAQILDAGEILQR